MGTSDVGDRIVQVGTGRSPQAHVARIGRRVAPVARHAVGRAA